MTKKGQISIEYTAGFLFFMFAAMFVIFSLMNSIPPYYDESNDVIMHESAWAASERAMAYAVSDGVAIGTRLQELSKCTQYAQFLPSSAEYVNSRGNYTYFKSLFGVPNSTEFRLTFKEYGLAVPDGISGTNYTGTLFIDGASSPFEISNSSIMYDGIRTGSTYALEGQNVTIGSSQYSVEEIDPRGRVAIISKSIVDCGRQIMAGKNSASVKRYVAYNGSIARMELTVWR